MTSTRILSSEELKDYGEIDTKTSLLKALFAHQLKHWPLLKKGATSLSEIKRRDIKCGDETLTLQFNPARMVSIAANVDPNVIKARACFLCLENLSTEQTGVLLAKNLIALANPMPIFPEHFTLAAPTHSRQDITSRVGELLNITKDLDGQFTVFFNGAKAGASAPDHYHLQACPSDSFPLIKLLRSNKLKSEKIGEILGAQVSLLKFGGNNYISLKGNSCEEIETIVERLIHLMDINHSCGKEMINVVADYFKGEWQVIFIPREKHRPDCFYEEEPNTLMISPATVEMSGVIVTARESDFSNITEQDVRSIFDEVMLNTTSFSRILEALFKI